MTASPPRNLGLRERKRAACAAQIHEAAVRLVVEHGYEAVTVAQIAEAAEVSAKTVFNYWGSKDGAILGIEEDGPDPAWVESYLAPENTDPFVPIIDLLASRSGTLSKEHSRRRAQAFLDHPRLTGQRLAYVQKLTEDLAALCARKLRQLRPEEPDEALIPEARLIATIALTVTRHAWQEFTDSDAPTPFHDHLARSVALHKKLCADFVDGAHSYKTSGGNP
ncbi:TetR/AcrR family transcriptional regulator [Segniliparus rugosus]|uniref:HTH tetR-type domain-containing protein n=1 Tax=Segniliparus rugosus (strain ATCC BAA-974 / DSM 45345 / CCUG 50838 / CIP 108380 / JCM 13579 / CDC 945) TaxID=679197 RepID=E5XMH7_SEGRC|nr:TetR/AcrR family transcriptional regulator [Segniliparus rugosus]EFV14442.2 hypothetical protein HMPREF9336_00697 [Segniliparus rugosus ATCC BAA-974]